jgi:hypothetical protein
MPKNPGWLLSFSAALCAALSFAPVRAGEDAPANALLVLPSDKTAFDKGFQEFLDKGGVRLLQSYPPSVFVGYVPPALDAELGKRYSATVYRDRVDDWGSFARYGEKAVYAVNAWNKRFVDDPPYAPMVVSSKVKRAGRKDEVIDLAWNEVMKAAAYRLQISTDPYFSSVALETLTAANNYRVVKAFWPDGVYYWRVAGLLKLNNGRTRDGNYSEAYSYAVSRPYTKAAGPAAPALKAKRVKGSVSWEPGARYYRLQIAQNPDFSAPVIDVFTDTCAFRLAGLPLAVETPYFMRAMASDGAAAGPWSGAAELTIEPR